MAEDMCAFLHAIEMGTSNFALKDEGADARRPLDDAFRNFELRTRRVRRIQTAPLSFPRYLRSCTIQAVETSTSTFALRDTDRKFESKTRRTGPIQGKRPSFTHAPSMTSSIQTASLSFPRYLRVDKTAESGGRRTRRRKVGTRYVRAERH